MALQPIRTDWSCDAASPFSDEFTRVLRMSLGPMSLLSLIATQIRASATGRCRLPAPLSWRLLTRDRASAVQRAILLEYLRTGSTAARLLGLAIALLFWPFRSFAQVWKQTRAVGGQVTGIRSRPAQFAPQLRLAWFHGISPDLYYQMGVARAKARVNPMEWLQNGHGGLLSRGSGTRRRCRRSTTSCCSLG